MDAAYLQAAIPEPYRILGIRLRSFSIGHLFLLHRHGCNFITAAKPPWIDDLILGILVCGLSYEEGVSIFNDQSATDTQIAKWRKTCLVRRFFGIPFGMVRVDWVEKANLFRQYLDDAMKIPKAFVEEKTGNSMGAPMWQTIRVSLLSQTSLTNSEILNMPLALAFWDYLTLGELKAQARIFNEPEHKELTEKANDFHERWLKTHGGKRNGS